MTNTHTGTSVSSRNKGKAIVQVSESSTAMAADAAEMFLHLAEQAEAAGRPFRVALSGGSTPKLLYGILASDTYRDEVPWDVVRFYFGDERWVPHSSRECNYKLAKDELLEKVGIDKSHIFPIPTENVTPDGAAQAYEDTLRESFGLRKGAKPRFDLVFLGMGDDGHTASLFPHTDVVREEKKLVAAPYVEKLASHRITLTAPVLQAAREVLFLAAGEDKAPAIREVLEGAYNPEEYPSQLLRKSEGTVTWFLDRAAASQLEGQYIQV